MFVMRMLCGHIGSELLRSVVGLARRMIAGLGLAVFATPTTAATAATAAAAIAIALTIA